MNSYISQIKNIETNLVELQNSVKMGGFVDLTQTKKHIKEICDLIKRDPPADTSDTIEKLDKIITDLNSLESVLKHRFNKNHNDNP